MDMSTDEMRSGITAAGQTVFGQIFVLRLWPRPSVGLSPGETWRASLLAPRSRRRRHCRSATGLTAELAALAPGSVQEDDNLEALG